MKRILPIIVISQFLCTSLWFAGNAVAADMVKDLNIGINFLAPLTSAVQFGFIIGTLLFAIFSISDRFSPSLVFFISALFAGFFNLGLIIKNIHPNEILICRFFTGLFLAGIYPVGMKIASDYYQAGLGKSLGFLVGALVIGTAFPHLLKSLTIGLSWKYVLYTTTSLSVIGGLSMLLFVPDGPYRKKVDAFKFSAFANGFKHPSFRSAAFGYFGHMWELYTFWAFLPIMLVTYNKHHPSALLNVPLLSFLIIALGCFACVASGLLSQKYGAKKIASLALLLSCICCIISPLFLQSNTVIIFISFLFFWGIVVIADSPLFSTLVAQNAPEQSRGTALTIVNCLGFSITIISIQVVGLLSNYINFQYIYMVLAIGPILGLFAFLKRK